MPRNIPFTEVVYIFSIHGQQLMRGEKVKSCLHENIAIYELSQNTSNSVKP